MENINVILRAYSNYRLKWWRLHKNMIIFKKSKGIERCFIFCKRNATYSRCNATKARNSKYYSKSNLDLIQKLSKCTISNRKQFERVSSIRVKKNLINRKIFLDACDRCFEFSAERDLSKEEGRSEGNFEEGTLSSQSMLITRPGWQTRTSLKFLWANVWARRRFRPPSRFQKTDTTWSMRAPLRWRLIEILINARCCCG